MQADRRRAVGWWPELPPEAPLGRDRVGLASKVVFPSGRAAIAQTLQAAELPPGAVVAVPTYSSECLVRVVRRFGTPVDIRALEPRMMAAVVYEQWGWPLAVDAWTDLNDRFNGRVLLVDRVDSADFFTRGVPPGSVEVLSLHKLLGIDGGGLARVNARLVAFEPQPESEAMRDLRSRPISALAGGGYRELFKESRQAVHPSAVAWLGRNCLETAAEGERIARQRHVDAVLNTGLARGWPAWMVHAVANGAGPVWAPVLRGQDAARRWAAMCTLDQRYGVVSTSRLFNWSGNPLRPHYEMALALPVHSGVSQFEEIIAALD